MKPFKSGKIAANWLLRITLCAVLFQLYFNVISTLNFANISFLLDLGIVLFGILIIIAAIISKQGLAVISGLVVALICIYKIVISFNGTIDHYLVWQLIPFSIGFYFFTNGNDN